MDDVCYLRQEKMATLTLLGKEICPPAPVMLNYCHNISLSFEGNKCRYKSELLSVGMHQVSICFSNTNSDTQHTVSTDRPHQDSDFPNFKICL